MKKQRKKQTLGTAKKRGPKPPACGRLRLSINMTKPAWAALAKMPGKGWTAKLEAAVWRLDEIENRRMISEGI